MEIRNVAIIAHVDHGKTTLVDGMLKQTHTFRQNQAEMNQTTILDQNALEREKGITILAKNTAVFWRDYKINIIDTPGHADFSGEVERVINMADGAILIVDAAEGPLPQTQFVLEKALERNLKIILVLNKIDRKDARPQEVLHDTEDLFIHLASHASHLDFTVLYAVGREGKAWQNLPPSFCEPADLTPLFTEIVRSIPAPKSYADQPFAMLVSTLDFDPYKGTYAVGKVSQGVVSPGTNVKLFSHRDLIDSYTLEHVYESRGLERIEVKQSRPGDIIAVTGIPNVAIGQTISSSNLAEGYPLIKIGEPTIKIQISSNTSPFAGREGKFSTARQLEERLTREKKTNIGLKIGKSTTSGFLVSGRGELHLAILIENLRREGYEMQVGKPEVILKEENDKVLEPFEEVAIEIDKQNLGLVIEEMGKRHGELLDTLTNPQEITRLIYKISSRNLLGAGSDILTLTHGNGIFTSRFIGYFNKGPQAPRERNGVLIALETGRSTAYALATVAERGTAFIGPGIAVYAGMIIGLNRREEDININVCKSKKLNNIHSETSDIAVILEPPTILTLEQSLDFIQEDELLEVTPLNLHLRKKLLSPIDRVRARRANSKL